MCATQCGGKEICHDEGKCITHDLWAKLNLHIVDYLGAVTLKHLIDQQKAKQAGVAQVSGPVSEKREAASVRERTALIP